MDNKNPPHPNWANWPFAGFPGEVEDVPEWPGWAPNPEAVDDFDKEEVWLEDKTLAGKDCWAKLNWI